MYDYNDVVVLEEINVSYNPENREKIDLCVLNSFGWSEHLRQHIRLFKKNCLNDFYYTVFDVQFNEIENKKVEQVCIEENVSLVKIKFKNRDDKIRFLHHRLKQKLNYIYNDYVKKRGCKYYGMLQQDFYLTKKIDFISLLKQNPCIGRIRTPIKENNILDVSEVWYLWEGFIFLDVEVFKRFSFAANYKGLDTYDERLAVAECGIISYYDHLKNFSKEKSNFFNYVIHDNNAINDFKKEKKINSSGLSFTNEQIKFETNKRCEIIEDYTYFIHGLGCGFWHTELFNEILKKNNILLEILKKL